MERERECVCGGGGGGYYVSFKYLHIQQDLAVPCSIYMYTDSTAHHIQLVCTQLNARDYVCVYM